MNNEIDREAMLIYLNDLRTMETITHEDDKKTYELNKKNEKRKAEHKKVVNDFSQKKNSAPSKPSKEIVDDGMSFGTKLMIFFSIFTWGCFILMGFGYDASFIDVLMDMPFVIPFFLFFPICSVILFFKSKRDNLKLKDEMELKYTRELKEWKKNSTMN